MAEEGTVQEMLLGVTQSVHLIGFCLVHHTPPYQKLLEKNLINMATS